MISTIYIEEEIRDSDEVKRVLSIYKQVSPIIIERYGEVFNRNNQNFRLQKQRPSLILAAKHKDPILPTPPDYSIGGSRNYYFSHMLNCLYDCRYCFLQGMYRSANYVYFINDAVFKSGIDQVLRDENASPESPVYFFSGYDCDSLALEKITNFTLNYFPFFRDRPEAYLELRTKSTNVRPLLAQDFMENVIVAFTLSPEAIARDVEHKAPSTRLRLQAAQKVAKHGWKIGLRLDPLIYHEDGKKNYETLFEQIEMELPLDQVHSVTLGPMRFPKLMFNKIYQLYPNDPLLSGPLQFKGKSISYEEDIEGEMLNFCKNQLSKMFSSEIIFAYNS